MVLNRYVTNVLSFLLGSTFTLFFLSIDYGREPGIVQESHSGRESEVFAIFLILSTPGNFEVRQTIRETWGHQVNEFKGRLVFALGEKDLNESLRSDLRNEGKIFGDLLFLPMTDGYSSLARKLLLSLQTINSKYSFKFLFKGDEDTYVNVPDIVEAMKGHVGPRRLYWGYFSRSASVKTRGKWKETEWFLCDKYLPYAYGGGYILSESIVKFIADNSDKLSLYQNEDVSVGAWVAGINVTRIHDIRFNTGFYSRGCRNIYLVVHKVNKSQMKTLHQRLTTGGKICDKEYDSLKTYLYNWSVVPSQCCSNFV